MGNVNSILSRYVKRPVEQETTRPVEIASAAANAAGPEPKAEGDPFKGFDTPAAKPPVELTAADVDEIYQKFQEQGQRQRVEPVVVVGVDMGVGTSIAPTPEISPPSPLPVDDPEKYKAIARAKFEAEYTSNPRWCNLCKTKQSWDDYNYMRDCQCGGRFFVTKEPRGGNGSSGIPGSSSGIPGTGTGGTINIFSPENNTAPANNPGAIPSGISGMEIVGDSTEMYKRITGEVLTGSAGTGKTYQIRERITKLEEEGRGAEVLLCATTGIAAVNMGPEVATVNSTLGFYDFDSLQENYVNGRVQRKLRDEIDGGVREVVLDEMSMMDGRQLDLMVQNVFPEVAEELGVNLKLTLTGDFCQLPPVGIDKKRLPTNQRPIWAFQAKCWAPVFSPNITRLTKVWRQDNQKYVDALQLARQGKGWECVSLLQQLGVVFHGELDKEFEGATLQSKNDMVDNYNALRLAQCQGAAKLLNTSRWAIPERMQITGEWDWRDRTKWKLWRDAKGGTKQPTDWKEIPESQVVKIGEYVMILVNDRPAFTYANGDTGWIREIDSAGYLSIELKRNGKTVKIGPTVRRLESGKLPEEYQAAGKHLNGYEPSKAAVERIPCRSEKGKKWVLGEVYYHPIRPAWATTIHKSQGLSLDSVQIDFQDHFFGSPAMAYVALSRCRTPEGLRLVGKREDFASKVKTHPLVGRWL